MNHRIVIGFSGKAGSGKTTCREILQADVSKTRKLVALSFASALREIAATLFNWDGDKTVYKLADGSMDYTRGRGLLIRIGQDMRAIDPNCWVNAVCNAIDGGPSDGIFVIDDARFKNEVAVLRERYQAKMIRVESPNAITNINDSTETELDGISDWDAIILNDGTKEQLRARLLTALVED